MHKTLEEYSIPGGSTINLFILDENSVEIDYSAVVYDNVHEIEEGFKGSYLQNENEDEEGEGQNEIYQDSEDWACSECTYINPPTLTQCDMCGAAYFQ